MRIESLPAADPAAQTKPPVEDVKLRKACKDFESLLVQQMLSKMRASIPKSDLFGSKDKEEIFQSMLDEEYAKELSESNSLGSGRHALHTTGGAEKALKSRRNVPRINSEITRLRKDAGYADQQYSD